MQTMLLHKTFIAAVAAMAFSQPVWAGETTLSVDAEAGNNTLNAVFDAALGERITAVSSAVGCTVKADEEKLTGSAKCSVPLTSIKVDSDDTKTEHFQQWATNKKSMTPACIDLLIFISFFFHACGWCIGCGSMNHGFKLRRRGAPETFCRASALERSKS